MQSFCERLYLESCEIVSTVCFVCVWLQVLCQRYTGLFDPFVCLALILDCPLNLVLLGFVNSLENIVNTKLG